MGAAQRQKGGKLTEGTIHESDTGGPEAKINIFSPDLPAGSVILTRAKPLLDRPVQKPQFKGIPICLKQHISKDSIIITKFEHEFLDPFNRTVPRDSHNGCEKIGVDHK